MALIELKGNPSRSELRRFGALWFPGFLILIGTLAWYRSGMDRGVIGLWVAAVCVAGASLLFDAFRRLLYFACIYAAYPIGWGLSHLLLAGVYFLVMTPLGLITRGIGRDPLQRRFERSAETYWRRRRQPTSVRRYFRQY
jgi:hypothetical protein